MKVPDLYGKNDKGNFNPNHQLLFIADQIKFNFIRNFWTTAFLCFGTALITVSWIVYRLEQSHSEANIKSFADGLWWGLSTILSIGYGDHFPITPIGRLCGTSLMFLSVVSVGLITTRLGIFLLKDLLLSANRTTWPSHDYLSGKSAVSDSQKQGPDYVIIGTPGPLYLSLLKYLLSLGVSQPERIKILSSRDQGEEIPEPAKSFFQNVSLEKGAIEELVSNHLQALQAAKEIIILPEHYSDRPTEAQDLSVLTTYLTLFRFGAVKANLSILTQSPFMQDFAKKMDVHCIDYSDIDF